MLSCIQFPNILGFQGGCLVSVFTPSRWILVSMRWQMFDFQLYFVLPSLCVERNWVHSSSIVIRRGVFACPHNKPTLCVVKFLPTGWASVFAVKRYNCAGWKINCSDRFALFGEDSPIPAP